MFGWLKRKLGLHNNKLISTRVPRPLFLDKKSWEELNEAFERLTIISGLTDKSSIKNKVDAQLQAFVGWTYVAVNTIQRRFSSIPMKVYQYKKKSNGKVMVEEVLNHPIMELLNKPSKSLTGRLLLSWTQINLDLVGAAFWLIQKNVGGLPKNIIPVSYSDLLQINFADKEHTQIESYTFEFEYGKNGGKKVKEEVTYSEEDIIYFRTPHPENPYLPYSPAKAIADTIDVDNYLREYQRKFFVNDARADFALITSEPISKEEAKEVLSIWKEKHQGMNNAFEPALLSGGIDIKKLSVDNKDFQFNLLAEWVKDCILAAYGVPEGKVGLVKNVNKSSSLAIDTTFNSESIKPRLDSFDSFLNHKLLPMYKNTKNLFIKHDNPIPRDMEFESRDRKMRVLTGISTINEIREEMGKPPVKWGDEPFLMKGGISDGPGSGNTERNNESTPT